MLERISGEYLGSDKLLGACLHGETQNVNEALNGVIWQKYPKRVYVGRITLEVGVASAVISYNDGTKGLLPVYNKMGITPGYFILSGMHLSDTERVKEMDKKSSKIVINRRKKLRACRKGYIDQNTEKEGETYASGAF